MKGTDEVGDGTKTAEPASLPWHSLAASLRGEIVLPPDDGYAIASQLELGQFDAIARQAIAYCASPEDVSAAVRFARSNGVRSGGHSYGGYSATTGLIIDVSRLNAVTVGVG